MHAEGNRLMSKPYWDYYRTIEDDLIAASRYVEFCQANYQCYSVEFARILMAAGSELDMVFKQLCKRLDSNSTADNINSYCQEVAAKFPKIVASRRYVRGFDLILEPFASWTPTNPPSWWTNGYNKIKHERNNYYHFATLENALTAAAGLMIVLFHYYSIDYGPIGQIGISDWPKLIIPYETNDPEQEPGTYSILYLT
jgi:hypothetical protein